MGACTPAKRVSKMQVYSFLSCVTYSLGIDLANVGQALG